MLPIAEISGIPSYNMGADLGFSYRLLLHPILGFHLVVLISRIHLFLSTGNNTHIPQIRGLTITLNYLGTR